MKNEIKYYEQGLNEYPKTSAVIGNFFMILWIALGTVACWFLYPLAAWIYIFFAIIMVFVVLRKLVCTNCYYYDKWCCTGWGKLSALFFKKGEVEDFSTSAGIKLAPFTYGLLSIVPIILIIISILQELSIFKIIILVFLLLISFYSGAISRKKSCERCKMRIICPGTAVK